MPESTQISPNPDPRPKKKRRWLRRLAWTCLAFVLLLSAVAITLRTDWAARTVGRIIEREAGAALNHGRLSIGRLDGSLLSRLTAYDVRLFYRDSVVVSIDTAHARYDIVSALKSTFRVFDLRVAGVDVIARQLPDSTWDILDLAPPETPAVVADEQPAVRIDHLNVSAGSARARFLSQQTDSSISAHDVRFAAREVKIGGPGFAAITDELTATVTAPVAPDPVSIVFRGEIGSNRLLCERCSIESARSSALGEGFLSFTEDDLVRGRLSLRVAPLHLGDLAFILPAVDPDETVTGEAEVIGSTDSLEARLSMNFSSGASATLQALIRSRSGARVAVDGEIRDLNPRIFVPDGDLDGVINATVDVDLTGRTLEAVSGPVAIRVFDSILNGVDLRDGQLSGRFDNGVGAIEAGLFLPGVALDLAGTIAPFADTVSYDLSGRFRGYQLSEHYAAAAQLDTIETRFDVNGWGVGLNEMTGLATLDVERLTGPALRLGASTVRARFEGGTARLDGSLDLRGRGETAAGSVSFDAAVASVESGWEVEVSTLRGADLDLAALVDTTIAGLVSVSGSGTANISGGELTDLSVSAAFDGIVGGVDVREGRATARFTDDRGSYGLTFAALDGSVDAEGLLFRRENGFEIRSSGRLAGVNVDTLVAAKLATDLNGSFNVRTALLEGNPPSFDLEGAIASSVVNEQQIDRADLTASLSDSALTFDVVVTLPNGGLTAAGQLNPYSELLDVRIDRGTLEGINLGAWLHAATLDTDVNGTFDGRIEGVHAEANLRILPSTVNKAAVTDGRLRLAATDSLFRMDASVDIGSGRARATVGGRFEADTTYQGMFRLQGVDVASIVGADSLASEINAGCSFVGQGLTRSNLQASVFCTGRDSRMGAARVDTLRLEAELDAEKFALTALTLGSNVGRISGSGTIPTKREDANSRSVIDLEVELLDLGPAAQLVGAESLAGEGTLTLSIGGSVESPSFSAESALAFLAYDEYRVSTVDGFADLLDYNEGRFVAAVDIGFSVLNDVPVQRTSFEVERSGDEMIITGEVRIDAQRRGRISAKYVEQGEVDLIVVDDLSLNLEGEVWTLSEEAQFEIGDRWSVKTFLIFSGDQQIAFDGYVDPNGEQNLIVTLEQIRLGSFTDLVGYPGVDGVGEGYVVLSGQHDQLELESNVRVQGLQTYGREAGDLDLSANYLDTRMNVDGRLSHSSGATLTARGFVPMRLTMTGLNDLDGSEPVQLAVRSDSVPMAWIRPFLDQTVIDRIDGHLVTDFEIGGTWGDPGLSGNARLHGGRIRLPEFNLDMRSIAGTFRLDGDKLLVDDLRAVSRGGTMTGNGTVGFRSLDDPTFDIDARLDKFRAMWTDTYQLVVTGDTKLTGSMIKPVFRGNVLLEESDIFMTEELMADEIDPVRLTERDLRILERRFGYRVAEEDTTTWDFYEALDLSLDTRIRRDVWFRSFSNPKMDIEFSGDLTVSKAPLEEEVLSGTITVNPARSRVTTLARKFEITTGTIQFNGVVEEAIVDVKAQYVVPSRFGGDEVKINLGITGQFDDMRLDLSSDPAMDTGAMVSYLTTGRPPGEGSVGGTQAAELAVGSLSTLVEGFANSELGLDVVEIQVNPTRGTYLTVGKYVSPRIYVSLTQPLVTNDSYQVGDAAHQTEMAIEYELISWLVAQVGSSRNQLLVNLVSEFAF